MDSEEYRTGYSLESLCDLALVPLDSEESRNEKDISSIGLFGSFSN